MSEIFVLPAIMEAAARAQREAIRLESETFSSTASEKELIAVERSFSTSCRAASDGGRFDVA